MTEMEVLELNFANAALGIATLICVLMVAWATAAEVLGRIKARSHAHAATNDHHLFTVPGLGLTMADGGEKVDEKTQEPSTK
ncbi:MAG TPA: hypothetical protein VF701_19455 [Thermoanaerobaculia bacterium]